MGGGGGLLKGKAEVIGGISRGVSVRLLMERNRVASKASFRAGHVHCT